MGRKLIDLTGQTFGRWTVLERAENRGNQPYWVCECGCEKHTIKEIKGSALRRGESKSCGCWRHEFNQKDLTNQKFGSLIAIRPTEKRSGSQVVWECLCNCGNTCYVGASNLICGHTSSCGCARKNSALFKDLTGQQFGLLTAIKPTEDRDFSNVIWECRCQCGKYCLVSSNKLLMGRKTSCGCTQRKSRGEEKIQQILEKNNIEFQTQKTFDTCKDINLLLFDFWVSNSYLIEFDGMQHFKSVEYFGGEECFTTLQKHDKIKNQWCKDNNITLIRIPYTQLNKITLQDIQPETSSFIVKGVDT